MAREREERRRIVVDAGRRTTEHSTGDRQTLILPEGLTLWNPNKAGVYVVDIIPYEVGKSSSRFLKNYAEPGDWYFERTFWAHRNVGVNNDSFTCPAKSCGQKCPVCEFRMSRWNSSKKEDAELAASLKPSERQVFLVLDHAEPQKGLQLWESSWWAFGKQLELKINNASEKKRPLYKRFADPEEGSSLRLVGASTATGDGGGSYILFSVDEFQERDRPLDPKLLAHGYVLDDIVRVPPYDELRKVFMQVTDDQPGGNGQPKKEEPRKGEEPKREAARTRDEPKEEPAPRRREEPKEEPKAAKPKEKVEWGKGMDVRVEHRGEMVAGRITEVNHNKELILIEVEGRDRPLTVDIDDKTLELVEKKASRREEEPPPRQREESRDDEPRRRPRDEEEPAPRRRAEARDDEPPPRRREETKEEPPPRRAGRGDGWDDEDAPPPRRAEARDDEPPPRRR